jgi:hypothetical protein
MCWSRSFAVGLILVTAAQAVIRTRSPAFFQDFQLGGV